MHHCLVVFTVVNDNSKCFCSCTVRRVPPHFSIPPENVEVMPGGSVNLTCVAIGSPMPFVKWRLGALELTPEGNIPIGKNVLMLNDIRESATYTCVAASDLGNIESDAEVRVKGLLLHRVEIFSGLFVHLIGGVCVTYYKFFWKDYISDEKIRRHTGWNHR